MAEYTREEIRNIEEKWRKRWQETGAYKTELNPGKPKFYALDMFPYPSGAGLHVGHPLGYIATDIVARFKRIKGFNVLHPMGFDAFGLPAEQYAIEHGIHPAVSTAQNIQNFKRQLRNIGFSYDWSREVQTCDPEYYKWTQWIFLQIFDSWFNRKEQKAERISGLIKIFEQEGNTGRPVPNSKFRIQNFGASDWKSFSEKEKEEILMEYRLAYLAYTDVNWCEALGTVLANDEVINGLSYRGGHPVVKRQMRQWSLRITEYADRLLKGLDEIDFSESMKEIQRNWIGKSVGAKIEFRLTPNPAMEKGTGVDATIEVFTTRPETIFGVDFMVLAPEHELVKQITTEEQQSAIDDYLKYVEGRSEVDRMAEVKKVTGCFTGAYAVNPFNNRKIPVWTSEYVLAGYGTGAIMGVPCGDERDHKFAKHFNIPITNIIGAHYNREEANPTYDAVLENSDFLNGMLMKDAIDVVVNKLEERGLGKRQVNYKMRDAGWSRQRYWGEPFPVTFKDDMPHAMDESELPLELPDSKDFTPSGTGEGPLANVKGWKDAGRDTNTMPTHAGAAWYFLRFTDPHNTKEFASRKALDYWNQVDVYIGGSEHAVAHLLYARLWVKVLHDLGYLGFDEPFKKLINQGKITGDSRFVYRLFKSGSSAGRLSKDQQTDLAKFPAIFVSKGLNNEEAIKRVARELNKINKTDSEKGIVNYTIEGMQELRVDVSLVDGDVLDIQRFREWRDGFFKNSEFIFENGGSTVFGENGKYICGSAIEKMSKSYFNVVNPDDIIDNYGADTLRLYEMFLGPLEQSKPWNTNGIDGVFKFFRKYWNLFHDANGNFSVSDEKPTRDELKALHKAIKKVEQDVENYSFNTSVSEFMICVNELTSLKCNKRSILEPFTIILSPYAPHITEEIWEKLGHKDFVLNASYPEFDEQYLKEDSFEYPISVNGKVRAKMNFALDMPKSDIEKLVLTSEAIQKWTEGKTPKKVIIVPGKIVNVVL